MVVDEPYAWYQREERKKEGDQREEKRGERMGGWAIAVHGGAGVDPNLPLEHQEEAKKLLNRCLLLGISALRSSLPAIDVVELVVCFFSFFYHPISLMDFLFYPTFSCGDHHHRRHESLVPIILHELSPHFLCLDSYGCILTTSH